ncbi:MAG TPA: hypothetical protein P5527_04740 [Kiritimatiellia bacterium]|nr:hypothetical protein [Kiritimatiellia bacterium]
MIESCNALLAALEGRCANEQALPELAAGGVRELLAMPWRNTEKLRPATASERVHEARFMIARSCYATAWNLAEDQPELYQPIFSGLLSRVSQYSRWMLPLPENPDAFRNLLVREACLMIEYLLKRQNPPASLERHRILLLALHFRRRHAGEIRRGQRYLHKLPRGLRQGGLRRFEARDDRHPQKTRCEDRPRPYYCG